MSEKEETLILIGACFLTNFDNSNIEQTTAFLLFLHRHGKHRCIIDPIGARALPLAAGINEGGQSRELTTASLAHVKPHMFFSAAVPDQTTT
jgi:hypothetical protein